MVLLAPPAPNWKNIEFEPILWLFFFFFFAQFVLVSCGVVCGACKRKPGGATEELYIRSLRRLLCFLVVVMINFIYSLLLIAYNCKKQSVAEHKSRFNSQVFPFHTLHKIMITSGVGLGILSFHRSIALSIFAWWLGEI